jgi:hypothetical protein
MASALAEASQTLLCPRQLHAWALFEAASTNRKE